MKNFSKHLNFLWIYLIACSPVFSQTSWTGISGTSWRTPTNWTNGVPNTSLDAIIGDANFTGPYQPSVLSISSCRSLTLGGVVSCNLTITKPLTIIGNLTINANGTITHGASTISVQGNWLNSGTYTTNSSSSLVNFNGVIQSIGGSNVTTFRQIILNTGSTVTLNNNISIAGSGSMLTINGTLNPNESPTYQATISDLTVNNSAVIHVKGANITDNYNVLGSLTANGGSIVDYSATVQNQIVSSAFTYATLRISGNGIKSLVADLPPLSSTSATDGNIIVNGGIFDISNFLADRGTNTQGGMITVNNNATLRIGGNNTFPSNYLTNTLVTNSTVEYGGGNQNIANITYGNLLLTSSGGSVIKTFPSGMLTMTGNLTSSSGSGSGVTFTATNNLIVKGNMSIGSSTTFNAGSYTHTLSGNLIVNGTLNGNSSTISLNGPVTGISGTGSINFYNLTCSAALMTAAANSNIFVAGNLSTGAVGSLTQAPGGTLTMTGTSKTITASTLVIDNLIITGSVSTSSSFMITGNLSVSGSLTATAGLINMSGVSKTISGAGTLSFYNISVNGSLNCSSNFSIAYGLNVNGTLSASTGTATFTGTSTLSGTANLYNIVLNGTSLQLATNAVLGIASSFVITAGTLNVTSSLPNSVIYNGTVAQSVYATTYHNLILSNGNTKTAAGNIVVNGDFTINASTTFNGSSTTFLLYRNWYNYGVFNAASSTIQFSGVETVGIYGSTTFNILTINTSSSEMDVDLQSNITAATVNMTLGKILTGAYTLTITNTRTGAGIIIGTIQRIHTFTSGVAYAFEGPNNTVLFSSVSGVTSVTIAIIPGNINDFPYISAINREYNVSVPSGTYNATLRLHYEDVELNGNSESNMHLWRNTGSGWANVGQTANSTTLNYLELSGLTDITKRWTCSYDINVAQWNGSVSTDWNTAANWTSIAGTPALPPSNNDIIELGTGTFIYQPTITGIVSSRNVLFGSVQAIILTLGNGGTFNPGGNIEGKWSSNITHTINVNNQVLSCGGDIILGDGITGHTININIGTGTVTTTGSIIQTSSSNIVFSGSGALNIGHDFIYSSGTFTAFSSSITFNGTMAQSIGGVTFNNLIINKSSGIASFINSPIINGSLNILAGELDNSGTTTVVGDINIAASGTFRNYNLIHAQGNWTNNGIYFTSSASIIFDGLGSQNISASRFNNFTINKASGTASLTGNVTVNTNLSILSGTLDLGSFTCNHMGTGGVFTLSDNANIIVGGASNFPSNFITYSLTPLSKTTYNGNSAQMLSGITYGHLYFSNTGTKTLSSPVIVNGDLNIGSGVTLDGSIYSFDLYGNWINSGVFIPSTSIVRLMGTSKVVNGSTRFNRVSVYGSYSVIGDPTFDSTVIITSTGSLDGGSSNATFKGDLTNNGVMASIGNVILAGTSPQTLRLVNCTTSARTVTFNGSVSPTLNSSSSPVFGFVNINNTGGVNPSVGWTILYNLTVASGASFNGGLLTHTFKGSVANNGTITSSGTLNFSPSSAATINMGSNFSSTGTVNFGGSGAITLAGNPASLQNVIISNTNAAGITPVSNWNILNKFAILSNAIFNASSYTYTVGGNIESSGTLNGNSSSFIMNGTGTQLFGSTLTQFYDFTVQGSVAAQSSFYITHNFVNNNSFDATLGLPAFIGSGTSQISGTASPFTLSQFEVAKTNATVNLAVNVSGINFADVHTGTLNTSTFTLTENTGLGLLNVADNAVLKIGGTNSLPAFSVYMIDTLSTIEYAGTTQSIAATPYGNLTISSTGTKTANAPLNIIGNFTLTNGTFIPGSYVDTLGGNWLMSSGSFTNNGNTIYTNSKAIQSISSTGAFNNLTINKTAGFDTLASNITVNGTLLFTQGRLQTGSYSVIIGTSGVVNGAAQATGWVYGKLQKNVSVGSNINRTFEVGSAAAYTPSTISFSNVTTPGSVATSVVASEHPNISTSIINANKSINRYWSFTNNGIAFTTASILVNWIAGDVDAGVATSNCKTANYINGTSWVYPGNSSPLSTSIQATGVTTLGDIAVGEFSAVANWTGNVSNNWSTPGNWSTGILPTNITNITIPTGLINYPTLSTGSAAINNLTIQSGASIIISGAVLQIGGTIINNGTFTATNGTVEMNGTNAQVIPIATFSTKTVNNFTVSNAAGVTLSDTLKLTGDLKITNGSLSTMEYLVLKSSASATARIAQITSTASTPVQGNVIVERYIPGRRKYRLMTSPVTTSTSSVLVPGQEALSIWGNWQNQGSNAILNIGTIITGGTATDGFDPQSANSSLFTYQDSLRKYIPFSSANGKNTKYTPLTAGTAYYMFVYGDRVNTISTSSPHNTVISAKGTVLTGDQLYTSSSVMPLSNVVGRYTMLGNPFASSIDWASVVKSNIANTYWGWDPNLNSTGGYVSVSTTGSVVLISPFSGSTGLNQYIQPGEGFFVKTTGASPTLTIREQDKSGNNNPLAFNPTPPNSIPLLATNLYYTNGANTVLADGAVSAYDSSFSLSVGNEDATKMTSTTEELSILNGPDHLSIDARPMPRPQDTLFLYMAKLTRPQYTLEIFANQMTGSGLQPFLRDNYLGTTQPLSLIDTNRIVFNVVPTDSLSFRSDRFKIIFQPLSSLPIVFISVKTKHVNTVVQVSWVVNESDVRGYQVQRSDDGIHFINVGYLSSTSNNNASASYEWLDNTPGDGSKYYRIKAIQNDATFQLSKVVRINAVNVANEFVIYPNPVKDHFFNLRSSALPQGHYTIIIFNNAGQKVLEQTLEHSGGSIDRRVFLSMKLPAGMYSLLLTDGTSKYSRSIIIEADHY